MYEIVRVVSSIRRIHNDAETGNEVVVLIITVYSIDIFTSLHHEIVHRCDSGPFGAPRMEED